MSVNRTVPRRLKNSELRTREHLTEKEVERLIKAVGDNRYGHRDATMILIAFRHGLRASELCDLRWDQVDFARAALHRCWTGCDRDTDLRFVDRYSNADRLSDLRNAAATVTPAR